MKTSEAGLDIIRHFEGCRLEAYRCPANILTIGYGHTGPDVKSGMKIDIFQASVLLRQDVQKFESAVSEMVTVPITQGQFDALVSFCYNLGPGALRKSTMLKMLNDGNYDSAMGQFMRWTHVGGRALPGLEARREAEQALFAGGLSLADIANLARQFSMKEPNSGTA